MIEYFYSLNLECIFCYCTEKICRNRFKSIQRDNGVVFCICLQVELTDKEFEKMLAVEEKQKKEKKLKKKPKREHHGRKNRILNRKNDRRIKVAKSDESGDEVGSVAFIAKCIVLCQCIVMNERLKC